MLQPGMTKLWWPFLHCKLLWEGRAGVKRVLNSSLSNCFALKFPLLEQFDPFQCSQSVFTLQIWEETSEHKNNLMVMRIFRGIEKVKNSLPSSPWGKNG